VACVLRDALDAAVADVEARRAMLDKVRVLAMALVNEGAEPSALRARPHGTCLRYEQAIESIGLSCTGNQGRKDDPQYVAAFLRHGARVEDKRLTGQGADGGQATALHYASKAGFVRTIELLLDHGADPPPATTTVDPARLA
jgi:hypothetical protein